MTLIVNGEKIEDSAIKREVERMRPRYEEVFADKDPEEREAQLLDWSKDNVIEMTLLDQEAKKSTEKIPQDQIDSLLAKFKENNQDEEKIRKELGIGSDEDFKEHIEMQMRVDRMLHEVCKDLPKPSKEDIRKYYEENAEQFESDEQIRVAHIVKYVNWQTDEATACERMKKAQEELKAGAAFETIVGKYTDCSDNGGDLGYITRGRMVEEFEDVVFNLGPGQVSDVFRTRFGFHIAKVYDRKPPAVLPFEQVKGQIIELLKEQIQGQAIDNFLDRLRGQAEIEEV
ncbi:MAG: peptidylprolyl isomerase [Phycisphaerales bacterium]|jgi:parvulin-like peptidyl-prolyl isomerase